MKILKNKFIDDQANRLKKKSMNYEIINIEGKGNVNVDGMKGDIKVYIMVSNSTKFKRLGLDLVYKKIVSLNFHKVCIFQNIYF